MLCQLFFHLVASLASLKNSTKRGTVQLPDDNLPCLSPPHITKSCPPTHHISTQLKPSLALAEVDFTLPQNPHGVLFTVVKPEKSDPTGSQALELLCFKFALYPLVSLQPRGTNHVPHGGNKESLAKKGLAAYLLEYFDVGPRRTCESWADDAVKVYNCVDLMRADLVQLHHNLLEDAQVRAWRIIKSRCVN